MSISILQVFLEYLNTFFQNTFFYIKIFYLVKKHCSFFKLYGFYTNDTNYSICKLRTCVCFRELLLYFKTSYSVINVVYTPQTATHDKPLWLLLFLTFPVLNMAFKLRENTTVLCTQKIELYEQYELYF